MDYDDVKNNNGNWLPTARKMIYLTKQWIVMQFAKTNKGIQITINWLNEMLNTKLYKTVNKSPNNSHWPEW